jgi:hypothetical protein
MSSPGGNPAPRRNTIDIVRGGLKRRYRRERRFRLYGIASVLVALASLALLFTDIVLEGLAGLRADAAAARGALRPRGAGHRARRQRRGARRGRLRGRAEAVPVRALPRGDGPRAQARAVPPAERRRGLRAARAPDGAAGAARAHRNAVAGGPWQGRCLCEGGPGASAIRRPPASARSRPRGSASSTARDSSICGSIATCSATATAAIPSSPASAAP